HTRSKRDWSSDVCSSDLPLITSIELSDRSVIPLTRLEWRTTTESNQPTRRGRPVVVPYSRPTSRMWWPSSSNSSVGKGPSPTRDVYALHTPTTFLTCAGPTPQPTVTFPATGLLDVTNGYVPWSTSSMTPCAPSNRTFSPSVKASSSSLAVSHT